MASNVQHVQFTTDPSGSVHGLVSVAEVGRLSEEKCQQINKDLETAIAQVFAQHGVDFCRKIFKRENSREVSMVIRGSIKDANGLDALHRDLLEYCHQLKFKASIMNASLISDDVEYQVSGLDLSTKNHQFRVTSVLTGEIKYVSIDTVKQVLPQFFY